MFSNKSNHQLKSCPFHNHPVGDGITEYTVKRRYVFHKRCRIYFTSSVQRVEVFVVFNRRRALKIQHYWSRTNGISYFM